MKEEGIELIMYERGRNRMDNVWKEGRNRIDDVWKEGGNIMDNVWKGMELDINIWFVN